MSEHNLHEEYHTWRRIHGYPRLFIVVAHLDVIQESGMDREGRIAVVQHDCVVYVNNIGVYLYTDCMTS